MRPCPGRWRAFAAALAAGTLCACGGPSAESKRAVNSLIAAQSYAAAETYLENHKLTEYGRKNMVLYYLDKGSVQHFGGKYKESDQSFDQAENRMEELYTKSITKTGGMFLLNDTTVDYAGEPFERALTNVFRALNYVFLGQPEEALVESRKVEQFLDELNGRLGRKSVYKDDAFARYLDSLLYEDQGKPDDARISLEAANAAYSWYASDYHTPAPRFDFAQDSSDAGELVFIHYNGVAPRKVSKTFQVAWNRAIAIARKSDDTEAHGAQFQNALAAGFMGGAITVAYPEYVQDPYSIAGSEVYVDSSRGGSSVLMEDISAIAFKNLRDRLALIEARAIARATVKYVLAKAASDEAARKYGENSWAAILTKTISSGAAAATEIADTRGWAALPSQIRMARVKLPPGRHQVRVDFKNGAGAVVSSATFKDVEIGKGKRTYLQFRTAI